MVLKIDMLESFDSVASKIDGCVFSEGLFPVCLALCNADCQYFMIRVITPYSLCCDLATRRTAVSITGRRTRFF